MQDQDFYDERHKTLVSELTGHDIHSEEFTTGVKNLKLFSESLPPRPEPEPAPDPVPTTRWERVKCATAQVWDNETTRVFIKAGGAFAGVGLVVWSTIHKDHVMERQALAQANQRST